MNYGALHYSKGRKINKLGVSMKC